MERNVSSDVIKHNDRTGYQSIKNDEAEIEKNTDCEKPSDSIHSANSARFHRCIELVKSLRTEPVMFLFMFSYILNSTCLTNMIMEKGCLYYLNYSKEICANLSHHKNASDDAEILANNYNLYINLLAPIGAVIVIFLAPWSDKHGRKPPLIVALFGYFIYDVGIILCTIYFNSLIEYIIVSNLAIQITGGFICIMTVIYSLTSETSSTEFRSLKYTFLQIAFGLAVTLGALAGGQIYDHYGYLAVFTTMTVGHLLAIAWVIFFVPETQGLESGLNCCEKFRDLCSSQNFTDGLKTCLKSRENKGRTQLWLLLLSACTIALTYEVYTNIAYVYAHHMYKWGPTTYSLMWTVFSLLEMIVFLVCTPLLIKVFKLSDPLIGIIGSVSIIGKNIFLAVAFQLWLYYMSKVFSFLATCEAIVPLMAAAIIAKIFNATIKSFPGTCYLAATVFLMLPLSTFIWLFRRPASQKKSYS
ncbi:proton-coupled folate transporter-like isoform X2 [Uloborus diversus]|uniref:proton-coupled folate transporter-like isoform X2 n=1 Tax=Uloborus diversus TaxID=327109 RepID=UPI00240A0AC2|nr:proton-coupled folate transporter-like isoform X2 [Uloborus diversus]